MNYKDSFHCCFSPAVGIKRKQGPWQQPLWAKPSANQSRGQRVGEELPSPGNPQPLKEAGERDPAPARAAWLEQHKETKCWPSTFLKTTVKPLHTGKAFSGSSMSAFKSISR